MDSRKKEIDAEFTEQYTLSPEAFKQLIADKIKRNIMYSRADTSEQERQVLKLAE
jgi:RecA/RadA recombinase